MELILSVALAVVLVAAATMLVLIRRSNRRTLQRLEARVARAERQAAGDLAERLRTLRRKVGVLYFDGLPATPSRQLRDIFVEGVRHASRNQWDQAARSWQEAFEHARDGERTALYFLIGACHFASGRRADARGAFDSVMAAARRVGDRYAVAATVNAQAMLAREEGSATQALNGFVRAAELWGELGELRDQARALRRTAELHEAEGDLKQALVRHREALRQAEQAGDAAGAICEYGAACRILVRQNDYDAARAACEDGLLLVRKVGDRDGEVDLLVMLGDVFLRQRSYKRALDVLERALRHRGGGRSRVAEARILAGLAEASEGMARADVASEYYERAMEKAAEEDGLEGLQASCLAGLARGARHHGVLDKARSLLSRALELDRVSDSQMQLGCHLVERAVLALEMHDPAGAARDLDEAQGIARATGDSALSYRVTLVKARMLAEDGRVVDAQKELESLAEPRGDAELAADYHFESGHVARARGDEGSALESWRRAAECYGRAGAAEARARVRMFLAEALAEAGQLDQAVGEAAEALRFIARSGTRKDEIRALRAVAFVDARRERTRDAHLTLDRAVDLARKTQDRWSEAASLLALGRLARDVEVFDAARDNLIAARRLFGELGAASRVIEIDEEIKGLPLPNTGVQFLDRGS